MQKRVWRGVVALGVVALGVGALAVALAAAGCGSGGGEGEPTLPLEVAFEVPPLPRDFADGSHNNQAPPAELLAPAFVPRSFVPPDPVTPARRAELERDGLALVRQHLSAQGYGALADVAVRDVVPDEFGAYHVKLRQLHDGIPVIGAGFVGHLYPDLPSEVTDHGVPGLSVDTIPRVPDTDAVATAEVRYAAVTPLTPTVQQRLAVLPTFTLVRLASAHAADHLEDFDYQLVDAKLVWEITLAPALPDLQAVLGAELAALTPNVDPDDEAMRQRRAENATRGGHEAAQPTQEEFTSAVTTPGIRYFVDAVTGDVLEEDVLLEQFDFAESEGTGYSYFSGKVELSTAKFTQANAYLLNDITRPNVPDGLVPIGNIIWDAKNKKTHDAGDMDMMADSNNTWGDGSIVDSEGSSLNSTRRQTPAVDVAYAMQMTWDMHQNVFGRWGMDGNGTPNRACVHYDDEYTDAHYNTSSKFICFGDSDSIAKAGNYSVKTVGHELGHAFWHAVGNGTSLSESKALNEGHGDIQGSLVDFYKTTGLGTGNQIRHFANFANWTSRLVNPAGYDEEDENGDTWLGMKYWSSALKDRPPHVAGIPLGRAFIYLAEGAPSDSDDTLWTSEYPNGLGGIGITKAAHIWKTTIAYYIEGSPNYKSMRNSFLQATKDLYGYASMEYWAVWRAFAAVRTIGSHGDEEPPEIPYASVYAVNLKDMTARIYAVPKDDTGFRQLRVKGHKNHGYHRGDYLLGYASITRAPIGTSSFTFEIEDSAGKKASVQRSFLKARDRNLIVNGDFEDGTLAPWESKSGVTSYIGTNEQKAFIGEHYLIMEGLETVSQRVEIPAEAEDVTLVFRVLVRDSTASFETLDAQVLTESGNGLLKKLATYGVDTPKDERNWLNKGFLRQEFDLSEFAGQTVRIAFRNLTASDRWRFVIDQVVLTYTEDVFVDVPQVSIFDWENTVVFQLPTITGALPEEVGSVQYFVDDANAPYVSTAIPTSDWYAGVRLDDLGPGAHWVGARVKGKNNQTLGQSAGVWFVPKQVNELLDNGGFEEGAWDLIYSDLPPKVEVVEDQLDASIAYDGEKVLRMGSQGTKHTSRAGQVVEVPKQLKSLDFSVRIRISTAEDVDEPNLSEHDEIWLQLWNANTFEMIEAHPVTGSYDDDVDKLGQRNLWANYWRRDISLSPGKYTGKDVIVLLVVEEDDGRPTTFYLDNVSLRYTLFGIQNFNPPKLGP